VACEVVMAGELSDSKSDGPRGVINVSARGTLIVWWRRMLCGNEVVVMVKVESKESRGFNSGNLYVGPPRQINAKRSPLLN
jgi:hypothetical protein